MSNFVGTLLVYGQKEIALKHVKTILEARNRKVAVPTVPPEGLCLIKVEY